ncbi:MAG: prenyltransferase/squalene oxidase repeat-containing protein [Planctomycetota bacterium]
MPPPTRLQTAYQKAKRDLLAERTEDRYWEGELCASALSTATAISALALADKHGGAKSTSRGDRLRIEDGVRWLLARQAPDGGWGDTDKSHSNIATTMLVVAALHLSGDGDSRREVLSRAKAYIESRGGMTGLRRRYGKDKTFAVPILTNYALAGLVDWSEVSPLPFELACVPQRFYRWTRMPVVSYAIPALVAIGQARFFHRPSRLPWMRLVRRWAIRPSLRVLERMQPASGGYLEAVPLTSFVVMSLAAAGKSEHVVTQKGLAFIRDSLRHEGSWPIDTNLATWNTSLAINALATVEEDALCHADLDWLLSSQHTERHPFTGAPPGGWGWTDLSGAVPDADDTAGALLALAALVKSPRCGAAARRRTQAAATRAISWLLNLQNRDGGWPTFCRGWGKLPFDRSGADLTAHALRALHAWRNSVPSRTRARIARAAHRGRRYLRRHQRPDGSWVPLWFGHQDHPDEQNPVVGTARVLKALQEIGLRDSPCAVRACEWLRSVQQIDGGWRGDGASPGTGQHQAGSSVEETALAVDALLGATPGPEQQNGVSHAVQWLVEAVLTGRHRQSTPIGFYFAKLWYYERLYPLVFTVAALGHAIEHCTHPAPRLLPPMCVASEKPGRAPGTPKS